MGNSVSLRVVIIMWAIDKVFAPQYPVWTGAMAVLAFVAGLLLILTH